LSVKIDASGVAALIYVETPPHLRPAYGAVILPDNSMAP